MSEFVIKINGIIKRNIVRVKGKGKEKQNLFKYKHTDKLLKCTCTLGWIKKKVADIMYWENEYRITTYFCQWILEKRSNYGVISLYKVYCKIN